MTIFFVFVCRFTNYHWGESKCLLSSGAAIYEENINGWRTYVEIRRNYNKKTYAFIVQIVGKNIFTINLAYKKKLYELLKRGYNDVLPRDV